MCGIFGIFNSTKFNDDSLDSLSILQHHRGPDNFGYHKENNFIIANNRLSIIDLDNGDQPIYSQNKKIILVQNGEIYNYIELRNKLKKIGYKFKTKSDTEVILKCYENYGIKFLNKIEGVFSIIIHDKNLNKSFIIRDRFGEKPLFFFKNSKTFVVSSELRVIKKYLNNLKLNHSSIVSYLRHNYINGPKTIFNNVFHIDSGNYIIYDHSIHHIEHIKYFDLIDNLSNNKNGNLYDDFEKSVNQKTRSDVGYSVLLSGGIDSSAIISQLYKKVNFNTYSIIFDENKFDESSYVRQIDKKLNLKVNYIKFKDGDLNTEISKTMFYQEQPHGDSSFIALRKICEEVSKYEKVALSGDGADEIFGGYDYYFNNNHKNNIEKYILNLSIFDDEEVYKLIGIKNIEINEKIITYNKLKEIDLKFNISDSLMIIDNLSLLPYNNFIKCDRMSMASGLELRTPFISKDLVINTLSINITNKSTLKDRKFFIKNNLIDKNLSFIKKRKKQTFILPINKFLKSQAIKLINNTIKINELFNKKVFKNYCKAFITNDNYKSFRKFRNLYFLNRWLNEL
tara:strand:- start:8853 stop:10553 length:1701 start_codon:yes stop_codon:yes gene_type:complete